MTESVAVAFPPIMHSPTQWFVLGLVLTVHSVTAQVFAINHIDTPHEGIPAGEEFSGYVTWTEPSGVPPFTVCFAFCESVITLSELFIISGKARNLDFEFLSGVSNVAVDIISAYGKLATVALHLSSSVFCRSQ